MTVKIEISPSDLYILARHFQTFSYTPSQQREARALHSVLNQVSHKIQKKSLACESDLFSQKKKVKLSMEFYEAHFLELFINQILDNAYIIDGNELAMRSVRDKLNQKLA